MPSVRTDRRRGPISGGRAKLGPICSGTGSGRMYLNFLGHGEDDDLVRSVFGGEAYAHLAKVKRAYDPENLLRMNQNVRPA
jgi:FAD/FMN-containing dehydrogenase